MNKFISDVKQLKINKFIKSIWQLIISNSNATLELPSLRLLLHSSSTVISSECITTLWLVALFCDSDEIKSISFIEHLFFSFPLHYFIYQLNFSVFWLAWVSCSHESSLTFYLVLEFLVFVLFRMLWMLFNVNKAKFSLRKTMITFSKILASQQIYNMKNNHNISANLHHEKQW